MNNNYNFYMETDVSAYIGKWIAICDNKIVSSGKDVKKVFKEAKEKYPKKRSLVTRVPDKETMIF
ncbi:MAG: succinyl-CoA synthetase subunit alpha [Nanoarchaeota archaeon]|nr:succinyl-CoA synthetase subunit alpha [Nanoarchaeota archaeon]MBU1321149.1 succinyl-CoA synthetase subunit alpha [Nanoarchaeota archaeon]MBU1597903.1 succinyl-CoA synthetase subunit alpha [Nanoarchaeota archaeon]MBU2441618.1 succinyl-CoA synthetase subunit alpha [Nanoarchaeota archaeon]